MDRQQALRLRRAYSEPQTLRTILNHVGRMARCGFSDTTLIFEDKQKAIGLSDQLMARGFVADIFSGTRCTFPGKTELVVKWA